MKMKRLLTITVLVIVFNLGDAYTKYGRTCQDIGCPSNEVCVLKEDPCTLYTRNGDCGKYPSCEKVGGSARTCENYICPPSQTCKIDKGIPKCFESPGMRENKRPVEAYSPISPNAENMPNAPVFPSNPNVPSAPVYPSNPNANYPHSNHPQQPQSPNYPQYPNSGMYPQIPSAGRQTTQRPNIYQPGHQYPSGGGYVGGQVGSGYPGYPQQGNAGRYPAQGGGYPVQQGGYPGQQYPGQGSYNTNYNGRYPQQSGYPSQGNYPAQGSYGNTKHNQYGHKQSNSASNPILDKITNTLKTLGLFWFLTKYMTSRIF